MDEFNPGQSIQMQSAWENYRHLLGESQLWNVAADGVSCTQEQQPTPPPVPTNPPTPPPILTPTPPPTPCIQTEFTVDILTDDYGSETSWNLVNNCDGSTEPVLSGSGYPYASNTLYTESYCGPDQSYTLTINGELFLSCYFEDSEAISHPYF